jgi:hypothetical protein
MTDRPCLVGGIQVHQTEDGFVVLSQARDRVHFLNPTATLIMMLCDGNNSCEEIADLLQREYDLATSPVHDVAEVLTQLRDEGLLTHQTVLASPTSAT